MKNKEFFIILGIIIFGIFISYIIKTYNTSNITEINLNLITGSNQGETQKYIFKEQENIIELLEIEKKLRSFKSEDDINCPYTSIEINIVYTAGKKIQKTYKIKPYEKLFENLLNSMEARKQSIPLLYENVSNVDKIILRAPYPKTNFIEIRDKQLIDEIIVGLREYYLSDKILDKRSLSPLVSIGIDFYIPGSYKIFNDNEKIINLLKEQDMYDELAITSLDIKDMYITKGNKKVEIKDKKLMDLILESSCNGSGYESSIYVNATLNASDDNKIYASILKNNIPQEIEKLLE